MKKSDIFTYIKFGYLGLCLAAIFDLSIFNWQYWAILMPMITLEILDDIYKNR